MTIFIDVLFILRMIYSYLKTIVYNDDFSGELWTRICKDSVFFFTNLSPAGVLSVKWAVLALLIAPTKQLIISSLNSQAYKTELK